jgi:hypothetical protein
VYTGYGHVSKPLSNLASNYDWEGSIASQICPWVSTGGEETAKYPVFGSEELFVRTDAIGTKTAATVLDWTLTWAYAQTTARAMRTFVPASFLASAAKAIKPKTTATLKIKTALDILRELRLVSLLDTTVGTTSMDSGDQSNAWATASSGTPLADINAGKRAFLAATGRKPNTLVIPDQVAAKMVDCAEWTDKVKHTHSDVIQNYGELPPKICGMKPLVPFQQYAAEQVTSTYTPTTMPTTTDVWGDNVYLMYVEPRPNIYKPSACYELGFIAPHVRTYPDPSLGINGGLWIQAEFQSVAKMINSYYVYRLQNLI